MATVTPSSLPHIDTVEVVDLRGVNANRVDLYMASARMARCVRLTGADALRVATLWRRLPEGEQARCHVPPCGLRFFVDGILLCEASICWRCNNLFGTSNADHVFMAFNAEDPISVDLLRECEAALGHAVDE